MTAAIKTKLGKRLFTLYINKVLHMLCIFAAITRPTGNETWNPIQSQNRTQNRYRNQSRQLWIIDDYEPQTETEKEKLNARQKNMFY